MKKMTCADARNIDLVDYLTSLGHYAKKSPNNNYWYLSPLRQERTASFKVDRNRNIWYDHGCGQGGDIIDFGVLYHNCSVRDFLARLSDTNANQLLSIHPLSSSVPAITSAAGEKEDDVKSRIAISDTRPLSNPVLLNYLRYRCIPLEIARLFCMETDFVLLDKKQTAIGFQNDMGGYELRNRNFKGSSSPKTIRFIDNGSPDISVFEGFFCFLSFQTINENIGASPTNCLVLNSLTFFEKSMELLEKHKTGHLFLDRDKAGTTQTIKALERNRSIYIDNSDFYRDHKDLNDWLIANHKKFNLTKSVIQNSNNVQIKTIHHGRI